MFSTNPFLQMIAALEDDGVEAENVQPQGNTSLADQQQLPAHVARPANAKLPEFWPHAPGLWFARADCRFEMLEIRTERQKFCAVVDALSYEATRLVADLIAAPPAVNPYQALKERLLLAHHLTPVQRAEKLLDLPELGARRPTDLLAAMYENCPAGEENTMLFRSIFLKRMPAEVRVLLVAEETTELKELATRADQLWLKFGQRRGDHVAAVQVKEEQQKADSSDEATVAAIPAKKKNNSKKKKRGGTSSTSGGQQSSGMAQKAAKGKQVFLCHTHLKYGSSAYFCAEPDSCAWPEN
jgi:hypothetical protein